LSSEEGTGISYSQFTINELNDLRALVAKGATIDAITYVVFLLGSTGDLKNAMSFVDNVIKKNLELKMWLERYYRPA